MLKKITLIAIPVLMVLILWIITTPPSHLIIQPAFNMKEVPGDVIKAKAPGDPLSDNVLKEIKNLPGHDEIILQEDLGRAFVTCMDGWIWIVDLKKKTAQRFVDPPLMAAGAKQVPGNTDKIVFCASRLYGETYPDDEKVGIYELTISTKTIRPLITREPILSSTFKIPKGNQGMVYAKGSPFRLRLDELSDKNSRPLVFCNDLDISRDGKKIYFSEPFNYEGASMGGGTIREAITLGRNGHLWCLNMKNNTIDCIGRGYSFVDGVLLEYGSGSMVKSVLITETVKFRIVRLFLSGEMAGKDTVLWKDLPGAPDGIDRDSSGRIWVGMLKKRSGLVNWMHRNPWIKHLFLRIPPTVLPSGKDTGIISFSSDCSKVLYQTMHDGSAIKDISVVVSGKDRIFLPSFDKKSRGLYSMKNPLN